MAITLVNRLVDSGSDGTITAVNTKVYAGSDITWANKKVAISNVLRDFVVDSLTKSGTSYTLTYHRRDTGATTGYVAIATNDTLWTTKSQFMGMAGTLSSHTSPYAFTINTNTQKRYTYLILSINGSVSQTDTCVAFDTTKNQWWYVDN